MEDKDRRKVEKDRFTVEVDGQGATGETGEQGEQGITGETGAQGQTGNRGHVGQQGVQGAPGAAGAVGSAGATGSDGQTGSRGIAGERGMQGMTASTDVFEKLWKSFKKVIGATILIFCVSIGGVIYTAINQKSNRDALCALRINLETELARSQKFLKEHPKGIPGVPVSLLLSGNADAKRSIEALGDLDCE